MICRLCLTPISTPDLYTHQGEPICRECAEQLRQPVRPKSAWLRMAEQEEHD